MKGLGLHGVCGEHAPQHVIQDLEPEQGATLVANHVLGSHPILEIVSVSGFKKYLFNIKFNPQEVLQQNIYLLKQKTEFEIQSFFS